MSKIDINDDDDDDDKTIAMTMIPNSPKPEDVICSNNRKWTLYHPGNLFYNRLIEAFRPQLKQSPTKSDYKAMADEILRSVLHQQRGRFLKPSKRNKSVYEVLNLEEAETKVMLGLRRKRLLVLKHPGSKKMLGPGTITNKKWKLGPIQAVKPASTTFGKVKTMNVFVKYGGDDDDHNMSEVGTGAGGTNNEDHHSDGSSSSSSSEDSSSSNHERTNHDIGRSHQTSVASRTLYGSLEEEMHMRRWLNEHRLPQSVGDTLLRHGARNVDDIALMIQAHTKVLNEELASLDVLKLKRTVASLSAEYHV